MDDRLERLIQLIRNGHSQEAEALVEDMRRCAETVKRLHEETERLQEAERMRTEFLALISHELRTPLNAIIGYNSLLDDGVYGDLNQAQRKAVHRVDRNAARLLTLINQLLELSRLESGAAAVFHEPTDLKSLVDELLDEYQSVAEEKGVELVTSYPRKNLCVINDAAKLTEMVRQLIANAVKFTQKGSVTVSVRQTEGAALLEVADTGPGIDEAKRETIFQLFELGEAPMARPHDGAGLGLAIVRRLSDLLKVSVELESAPGQGSVFRLRIPCSAASGDVAESKQDSTPQENPESQTPVEASLDEESSGRVLIVDDDPYMVEVLSDFLESKGRYHVDKAYSGMHAMLKLTEKRPDYLLVDLLMPNIKGERVIEYCTQMWKDGVHIVVITGKGLSQDERDELAALGVSDIFLKGELQQGFSQTLERIIPIPAAG